MSSGVSHACNLSTWKAETGWSSRLSSVITQ